MGFFSIYNSGSEAWASVQSSYVYDEARDLCMRYLDSKKVYTISDKELKFCRELYAAMNGWKEK